MIVVWQADAQTDIIEILAYIAADNPSAAKRVVGKLRDAGDSLAHFPERGRLGRILGTRELAITRPYIIVYEILPDASVAILRVWHAAQLRRGPDA